MKLDAAAQNPSLLYRPQGIALAILALVGIWYLGSANPTTVAILVIAILFFFALKKPVWAMAALLVSQLTVTSFMVGTPFGFAISLRLMLLILIGLILWPSFSQRQIDLGPKARQLLIPASILLGLSVAANVLNTDFDYAFKDFRNMVAGLMIVLFFPAVTRNLKDLKILCGVAFVGITASAIVGLMQHYRILGMTQVTLIPGFLERFTDGQPRVPGIAETELELAYVLATALLIVLSVYLVKGVNFGNKRLLLLSIMLMAPALYFTYTRSATLGLALGLVALVLFLKTRIRGDLIMATMLLTVILIEMTGVAGGLHFQGRSQETQEESSIARHVLWQAGMAVALDNPVLGIGGNQYRAIAPRYAANVDPSLLEWEEEQYWGYATLGSEAIHNDFLNMWVSYGTPALVAFVWLFMATLRNFLESYRISKRSFIKGLSIGLAAALVAYGANAFYHNLMRTLPLFWMLAGFSLVTAKLAVKNQVSTLRAQSITGQR
jgi:O-antigen ligase